MLSPFPPAGLPSKILNDETLMHWAMTVPDMDRAMAEMSNTLGVGFSSVMDVTMNAQFANGTKQTLRFKAAYTLEGPPYVELLCAAIDVPFVGTREPRMHHAGLLVRDVPAAIKELQDCGLKLEVMSVGPSGEPGGAFLWSPATGIQVELLGESARKTLDGWLFPKGLG